MKTLTILGQKGGAGKTSLAVHLAVCARLAGLSVALIDLDPQGSALRWNGRRPPDKAFTNSSKLPVSERGFDLAIVDTPPHTARVAAEAAGVADFILLPTRPAQFDLDALHSSLEICKYARKPHAVVLNAVPHNNQQGAEAAQLLEAHGVRLVPSVVTQLVAISRAVNDGRSVHEYDEKGRAAGDIQRLYDWIAGEMRL
jgi:chromosome partitioning protein